MTFLLKLYTLKKIKTLLDPEFYLNTGLSYILQKTLANFRCSSHDLMIEKSRHLSIDREYRFCPICKSKDIYIVEDEFHFFFHCSVYEPGMKYFRLYWLRNRNLHTFYAILKRNKKDTVYKVAKYLSESFALRKEILNELV